MKKNIFTKIFVAVMLFGITPLLIYTQNAFAQCNGCHCFIDDTTFTTIPLNCACITQTCLDDGTQNCDNGMPYQYAFYTQSDMCTIDSIVISGPPRVCWSLCCYPDAPPYIGMPLTGCSENFRKLNPPCLIGPGKILFMNICAASNSNTFTMNVYSNGSSTPCVLTFSN